LGDEQVDSKSSHKKERNVLFLSAVAGIVIGLIVYVCTTFLQESILTATSFSVVTGLIVALMSVLFGIYTEIVKKSELELLRKEFVLTSKLVTTSIEEALYWPTEHRINPEALIKIKKLIRGSLLSEINKNFFQQDSHILDYEIIIEALSKILTGYGTEIEKSKNRGLLVENINWESVNNDNNADNKNVKLSISEEYNRFVSRAVKKYAVEFRGVSLMPPCMWLDRANKYGLKGTLTAQKERMKQLLQKNEEPPIFERILFCPRNLLKKAGAGENIDLTSIEKLKKKHGDAGVKLLVVGIDEDSGYQVEDYTSSYYKDFVLIRCHNATAGSKWFVITSFGFNSLTRQDNLITRATEENLSPQDFLADLFTKIYAGFVEGRLIYEEEEVNRHIEKWNLAIDEFSKEDLNADVTKITS